MWKDCLFVADAMSYSGRPVSLKTALVLALVTLVLGQWVGARSLAQDATSISAAQGGPPLDMSREQWRERVVEAKRRAKQFALENRGRIALPPSAAEEQRIASERVLNDESLQSGDIVSTNKGLYLFKGRPDRERNDSDFIALQPR